MLTPCRNKDYILYKMTIRKPLYRTDSVKCIVIIKKLEISKLFIDM